MNQQEIEQYLAADHKANILSAAEKLKAITKPTNLIKSDYFSQTYGANIYIKPENLQTTGSFKIRGAFNKISNLTEEQKAGGIITASAGNHAQGCANSAAKMGVKATIVMPNITPLLKVNATKAYGAEVVLEGDAFNDAYKHSLKIAEETGALYIHPFDDYDVICGQGTIGAEILAELPETDEIMVPIGGGGLAAGIAIAAKTLNPKVKIIGVEPEGAACMQNSIREGEVCTLAGVSTCAEGVAVARPGDLTYAICRDYVDEFVTVSEAEIMEAFILILEKHKLVAETAGVIALAAAKKRAAKGKNIVCPISGGNIDMVTISSIINQGMMTHGRIMCFSVELPDRPWQLVRVSTLLAELKANVIELQHNQFKVTDRFSNKVVLEVTVETNGHEHIEEILAAFRAEDFPIARIY